MNSLDRPLQAPARWLKWTQEETPESWGLGLGVLLPALAMVPLVPVQRRRSPGCSWVPCSLQHHHCQVGFHLLRLMGQLVPRLTACCLARVIDPCNGHFQAGSLGLHVGLPLDWMGSCNRHRTQQHTAEGVIFMAVHSDSALDCTSRPSSSRPISRYSTCLQSPLWSGAGTPLGLPLPVVSPQAGAR